MGGNQASDTGIKSKKRAIVQQKAPATGQGQLRSHFVGGARAGEASAPQHDNADAPLSVPNKGP